MSDTDLGLLARYTRQHAEDAFAELVRRHLGLVCSAALRQVRSPQLAEEVAQSVFTDLARNAARLKPDTILTAWLYQVTRRTAIDVVRREASRQLREQIATEMNAMNATAVDWTHIEPLLDEAMHALDDTDRAAVLLRYFENKSLREVGAALGASENAAQKRLSRAVERLREFFSKRGVTVGASGLVVVISANAVQAASPLLAESVTAVALAKGVAASGSTIVLIKGALMAWTKTKTAVVVGAAALLAAGTATTLIVQHQPQVKGQSKEVVQTDFPMSSWASAGFATPPAALARVLWAGKQNDGKAILAGLTPELQQELEQRFAPELQRNRITLEEFLTMSSRRRISSITGFRVLDQQVVSDDQVLVHLYVEGKEREDSFKMRKIGDEWKMDQFPPDY